MGEKTLGDLMFERATAVPCRNCGAPEVEPERRHFATPVCFACLPPPRPLPVRHVRGCAGGHEGPCGAAKGGDRG